MEGRLNMDIKRRVALNTLAERNTERPSLGPVLPLSLDGISKNEVLSCAFEMCCMEQMALLVDFVQRAIQMYVFSTRVQLCLASRNRSRCLAFSTGDCCLQAFLQGLSRTKSERKMHYLETVSQPLIVFPHVP